MKILKKLFNKKIELTVIGSLLSISSFGFSKTETTYTVPKVGANLEDVTLPIKKAKLSKNLDGSVTLDYRLPPELDGKNSQRFKPTGSLDQDGFWHLKETKMVMDENGIQVEVTVVTAICSGEPSKDFSCEMSYAKDQDGTFHIDEQAAADYISSIPDLSPELIAKFEGAQQALSVEAIGIVKSKRIRGGGSR